MNTYTSVWGAGHAHGEGQGGGAFGLARLLLDVSMPRWLAAGPSGLPGDGGGVARGGVVGREGEPRRVMIVEDEALIALDLERRVQRMGFDVVGVADCCEEALELFEQERPDLVLMDVSIRGDIDGIETARKLGAIDDVPVVFITAFADNATVMRASEISPYGYLLKPFDDNTLGATVRVALSRHSADHQLKVLAAVVERVAVGVEVVELNDDGPKVVLVNDALVALLGVARGELVGGAPSVRKGWYEAGEGLDALVAAVAAQRGAVGRVRVAKGGRWVTLTASLLGAATGRRRHLLLQHAATSAG